MMDDEGSGPDPDDGPSRDHHHHDGTLKGSGRDHDGPMEVDLDPKHRFTPHGQFKLGFV